MTYPSNTTLLTRSTEILVERQTLGAILKTTVLLFAFSSER